MTPGDPCPICAGPSLRTSVQPDGSFQELCQACMVCWEAETRPNPDAEKCGNCAYRPGSPEQQDPAKWALVATLPKLGEPFYCHKRVPCAFAVVDGKPTVADLDIDQPGAVKRLCAGWVQARLAVMAKGVPA